MSRIIIIGDSHAGTIRKALTAFPNDNIVSRNIAAGRITDEFLIRTYAGEVAVNPLVLGALHDFKLYNPWDRVFNPSDANVVFLFGSAETHRFTMHEDWMHFGVEGEAAAVPLLPLQMVSDAIEERLQLLLGGLKILQDNARWKVSLMLGPPPHKDNAFIEERRPEWRGIVPPPLRRLLIWGAIRGTLVGFAEKAGMQVLDFTDSTCNADGFLLDRYVNDGVHGNITYGQEMVRQLEAAYA